MDGNGYCSYGVGEGGVDRETIVAVDRKGETESKASLASISYPEGVERMLLGS